MALPGGPIPIFASRFVRHFCECWNRRTASQYKFGGALDVGANAKSVAPVLVLRSRHVQECGEDDGMKTAIAFLRDQGAATSIEYALIAGGIAIAIIAAVNGLGSKLNVSYENVRAALP